MAISPAGFSSVDVRANYEVAIELVATQPDVNASLATARPPGQMVGFYNGSTDTVLLYMVDRTGYRFVRVG